MQQKILAFLKENLSVENLKEHFTIKNALTSAGIIAGAYFSYYTLKIYLVRRKFSHIPGPATEGLTGFFFGNMITKEELDRRGIIFADMLLKWHQEFGPVLKIQILNHMVISTTDPITIKQVLVVKNYPKLALFFDAISFPFNQRYLGHGLVTDPDNEKWRKQRSTFNPGFHRSVLITLINDFNVKANLLLERLRSFADGKKIIELAPELNHTTLDAIATIAFGLQTNSINGKNTILYDYIRDSLEIASKLFRNPLFKWNPFKYKEIRYFKKIVQYLREMGKNQILERSKTFSSDAEQSDIITSILKTSKSDSIDLEVMIDNFLTFFIAGQETTANTLSFCFLELAKNKAVFNKCREEIDQVLGSKSEINYEDITKLKYVSCVFKESLRLYPPASEISRLVCDEMIVNGLRIPKNTGFIFSTYVCSRMEENFTNCLEFKPERFMKDANQDSNLSSYSYFPFSIGPRNCIGQNFAQIEGAIVIAKLIQNFDFNADPSQSSIIRQDATIRPADNCRVTLTLRK